MNWIGGIIAIIVILSFTWVIFYALGRMLAYMLKSKNPFPGVGPISALLIWRYIGRGR